MSDRLLIINDLSGVRRQLKKDKLNIMTYIFQGIKFSAVALILRILFILPVFIFANKNVNVIDLYIDKYTFASPSYDEIWESFKHAFSIVFESSDYLLKYMVISFIILSIILIKLIKSPTGILIAFIFTVISPYMIKNIFLPIVSFLYVPVNFICSFIDGLIPSFIPVLLAWGIMGALFGIVRTRSQVR